MTSEQERLYLSALSRCVLAIRRAGLRIAPNENLDNARQALEEATKIATATRVHVFE